MLRFEPMQKEETYLEMMIQSLKLVALDAEMQIQLLPQWVHIPDEIALTFDDSYILFDQVIWAGLVNSEQIEAVRTLNRILDEMSDSDDKDLWTLQAIRTSPKWAETRGLAKDALRKLGYEIDRPDLGWITYVPGSR
jgi:hypothetical protein